MESSPEQQRNGGRKVEASSGTGGGSPEFRTEVNIAPPENQREQTWPEGDRTWPEVERLSAARGAEPRLNLRRGKTRTSALFFSCIVEIFQLQISDLL